MPTYDLYWSPTGSKIMTVTAKDVYAAKKKAPEPYRRYLGEIYAKQVGKKNPKRRSKEIGTYPPSRKPKGKSVLGYHKMMGHRGSEHSRKYYKGTKAIMRFMEENPAPKIKEGKWTPVHAVRFRRDGGVDLMY